MRRLAMDDLSPAMAVQLPIGRQVTHDLLVNALAPRPPVESILPNP